MLSPEFLIKAAQLFLSLSILIVLHELGHFIPAKLFGTRVEKFYLFFDVKYSSVLNNKINNYENHTRTINYIKLDLNKINISNF